METVFTFITGLIGAIAGAAGTFLFYRQNRDAKEIENDSTLAAEWEKLYREQKSIVEANTARIDDLVQQVTSLKAEVAGLQSLKRFVCLNFDCLDRRKE